MQANIDFCNKLKALGCDFIHVSTGGVAAAQQIPVGPKFQVPFATQIKKGTGLPTIAVGLITDPKEAEQIIADGEADMLASHAACFTTLVGPGTQQPNWVLALRRRLSTGALNHVAYLPCFGILSLAVVSNC